MEPLNRDTFWRIVFFLLVLFALCLVLPMISPGQGLSKHDTLDNNISWHSRKATEVFMNQMVVPISKYVNPKCDSSNSIALIAGVWWYHNGIIWVQISGGGGTTYSAGRYLGLTSGNQFYFDSTLFTTNYLNLKVNKSDSNSFGLGHFTSWSAFQIFASDSITNGGYESYYDWNLKSLKYGDSSIIPQWKDTLVGNRRFVTPTYLATQIPSVPVTSVFGRTGAVVAASNDYTFSQLASKPTSASGYGITSYSTTTWDGVAISDGEIASASTWNAKQSALSGTGIVKSTAGTISYISGTSSQFIMGDGSFGTAVTQVTPRFGLKSGAITGTGFLDVDTTVIPLWTDTLAGNRFLVTKTYLSSFGYLSTITLTINGTPMVNGNSYTISASANTLTTGTLNPTVINSSLQTFGTVTTGTWTATPITSAYVGSLTGGQVGISGFSATGSPSSSTFLRGDNSWFSLLSYRLDQFSTPNTDVAWGANKITGVKDPTSAQDAMTKHYADATYSPIASPVFTGTVTIPSPFILGATSVTTIGTQFNYLNAATGTTGATNSNLVYSSAPTFTGNVTVSTIDKLTLTTPATSATLTIADGKTLTCSNTLTFTGTDGSSVNFGAGGTMERVIASVGGSSAPTSSTSEANLAVVTIPANALNANGSIRVDALWSFTGSNSTRGIFIRVTTSSGATTGGSFLLNIPATPNTNFTFNSTSTLRASNSTSAQKAFPGTGSFAANAGTIVTGTINTTSQFFLDFNALVANAGDAVTLEGYTVTLINP